MSLRRLSLPIAVALALAAPATAQEFGYSGEIGPGHWGELSSAWHACADGAEQSPLDLAHRRIPVRTSSRLVLSYGETEGEILMVLTEPVPISDEHMARFNEIVRFNARPAQR